MKRNEWINLKWSEICIHTTNEAMESVANILNEAGITGLVIEDPLDLVKERSTLFGEIYELNPNNYPKTGIYIKAYLPADRNLSEQINHIKQKIDGLKDYGIDIGDHTITQNDVYEEEWETAWKKYYKPARITDQFTIVPTWEQYEPTSKNEKIIELDPGMAFGTGTHPTTVLSIKALEKYVNHNDLVLDVGCGSGVLSIASSLLGADHVYAYDLDSIATKSTISNIALNGLTDKVTVKQNDLLEDVHVSADVIVSNILAEIIMKFVQDAWNNLKENGLFITSGIIEKKKQLVVNELQRSGFKIIEINQDHEWISIVAQKSV